MFRLMNQTKNLTTGLENVHRMISTTSVCFREPPRKKQTLNPLTSKKQYERKVRRLEREIKTLEKADPKLKPILELQLPPHVKREVNSRIRVEQDEVGKKLLNSYMKVWTIYKALEAKAEINHIRKCVGAQEEALNVLKDEYPDLYREAIKLDNDLIPFRIFNPKKETPPIENFNVSDGRQTDITKEWKL